MNFYIIPAALITALFITLFISSFSKRPIQVLAVFLLLVFLATWAGQLWITPFGPITRGVIWVPLVIVSVPFSFLALALLPGKPTNKKNIDKNENDESDIEDEEALGLIFWIILIILILSIVTGYFRSHYFSTINNVAAILL